jgi:acetolactate decarboxylase
LLSSEAIMNALPLRAAALLLASFALAACGESAADRPPQTASADSGASPDSGSASASVWQLAPVAMLAQGAYDGIMPVSEVLRHGNLGLAGADALNGEMVLVDGRFYQFLASGQVVQPPDTMRLPFAAVTFWDGGRDVPVQPGLVYDVDSMPALDPLLPDTNAFYAVRMEGSWDTLVVRTFREQTRPYPPIHLAAQVVDTLVNVRGTLAGFRQPSYAAGLSLPDYHLHFVTEDHARGGHVLRFVARQARLQVSERPEFTVHMPTAPPVP